MPIARFGLSTCALDGKIYIMGGYKFGLNKEITEFYEYDLIADKWNKKADMLTPRTYMDTCVVDGKIYVISGWGEGTVRSSVEEYDPVSDKWSKKASIPKARIYLSVSAVDGKIYAMGGSLAIDSKVENLLSTVEEYDPKTDKWTEMPDMPSARCVFSARAVNGKIYAMGGWDGKNILSLVEEYDPKGEGKGIDFRGKLPATWGDVRTALQK